MEETRALTKMEEAVVRETAKTLGLRIKKLHRRISWEEFNERWFKGLYMFCDEPETPDHHLRHKNSGILMIDCDEDQMSHDKELVETEVATESSETEQRTVNHEATVDMNLALLEEGSIPQFQVPIANSEILRNVEIREENSKLETLEYVVMNENENLEQDGVQKYVNMKFEVDGDAVSIARQVFDSMPLETNLLRNMIRETFSKTWWFKFKAMTKPRLPRTKSSNLELILMKEEPQSVIVDEVTFETQRCNLIQAKRLMRKTNSLCNDESVYVLEDLSSAEETWFLSDKSKDIQAGNFVDGKLHFDHYKVVKKKLLQSHIIQQRRKLHLPSNSWMFEYKRGHKKLLRPTLSGTVRMIVLPKKEAEQKIHPLIEYEFHEAPMGMNIQDSEVGIKSVCQFPSFHVWRWQTNLVMQQVMRNKKFRFSKRWWFKYKSVEEGIKRLHIQLRYKYMLEFEEWLRSWGIRESWRNHNLEASHIQSSFAFNDFQSGFGVDIIILHGVQQQGCRILMLHLKKKGRFRPLQSFSRLILLALLNLWFSKAYEISGLLKDSSDDGAENSPVLNFVAEQPLLWLQNYSKKIHIVSELEKKKKKICYTSWMFKYKAPLKSIHDKLGKPKDRGALLIQQFQIKHKWRFKLLLSILALEIYLGSLVLVTNYAHQFHRLRLIILMGIRALRFSESMEETRALTKMEEAVVRETAETLGLRIKKLHRRISWEEFNERWFKGLYMFCDEPETPDHHLRHKNSGILMIDCDEDQMSHDKELVETEVATESSETEQRTVNHEATVDMNLALLEEGSIPQFQVPIANSEILRNVEIREENSKLETLEYVVMNENENLEQDGVQKYVNMKFEVDGDAVSIARQVFDSMPLETNLLRNMIRETFSKTWWFKFKAMTKPRLPRTKSSNLELILMKEEAAEALLPHISQSITKVTVSFAGVHEIAFCFFSF
ncbi:hypothetical protein ISN45_Aa08g002010 [Arabidopsis thaliana x Arabidopsis arenosa]|uniref:Uncharacterized protein n=1 Tax=Arabidopsis thaliana x Arabidopsis arenosa TaxID=1240361 RepID=A0A8T1XDF6_9BRAS|nr:hypothetical protein ISN45_Aa08g002010 [Arabidopsis thaliana x Arabidopsis arenosa]